MRDFNNSTFSTPINFFNSNRLLTSLLLIPTGDHVVNEQDVLHFVNVECLSVPKQFCQ